MHTGIERAARSHPGLWCGQRVGSKHNTGCTSLPRPPPTPEMPQPAAVTHEDGATRKSCTAEAPDASPRTRQGWGALLNPNSGVQLGLKEEGHGGHASLWCESGPPTRAAASAPICQKPHSVLVPQDGGCFPHSTAPRSPHPAARQTFTAAGGPAGRTDEETDPERTGPTMTQASLQPQCCPRGSGLRACVCRRQRS